jgi:hypothetical protein
MVYTPVIPALGSLRQEDQEFEAKNFSWLYTMSHSHNPRYSGGKDQKDLDKKISKIPPQLMRWAW